MSTYAGIERMLDADPLAARLARVTVPPLSNAVRASILAGTDHAASSRIRARVRRRALAVGLGAAAAVMLVAATPAGVAIARAVLPDGIQQHLGIMEGAPAVLPPPGGTVPGSTHTHATTTPVGCSQVMLATPPWTLVPGPVDCYADLSFAAAQSRVEFTIPLPSPLPAGLHFGAAVVDSKHSVDMFFHRDGRPGSLSFSVQDATPTGGSGVPSGSVEPVQVDGGIAYLAQGEYEDNGPGTAARWNPKADVLELTWKHDGLVYDVIAANLHLSPADMVRIAESVR